MDSQTIKLISRLRSGPYDATALSRIREELVVVREQLAAKQERKTLTNLAELLEAWAKSTADRGAASLALYDAAQIAELDLKDDARAAQLYSASLELNAFNKESLDRLEPLLRRNGQYQQLDALLNFQLKALTDAGASGSSEYVQLLRSLAKLRSQDTGNTDGAIQAYEAALDIEPDLTDVTELASLYVSRGNQGDAARAADLYYTLGDILEEPDRIPMLEKALDLVPNHEGALALLEKTAPGADPAGTFKLKNRWIKYLELVPSGPDSDARRRSLAQAYAVEGRYEEALACITEQVKNNDEAARKIYVEIRSKTNLAEMTGADSSTGGAAGPVRAAGGRAVQPKKTLVGYRVPDLAGLEDMAPRSAGKAPVPPPLPAAGVSPPLPGPVDFQPLAPTGPRMQPAEPAQPMQHAAAAMAQAETAAQPISLRQDLELDDETALRKKFPVKWLIGGAVLVIVIGAILAFKPQIQKLVGSMKSGGATTAAGAQKPGTAAKPAVPPRAPAPVPPKPSDQAAANAPAAPADTQTPPAATGEEAKAPGSGLSVLLITAKAKYRGGKLDKEKVVKTLEEKIPDLEKCYSNALKRKPKLKGELTYSWTVNLAGRVSGIRKQRASTISNTAMITCATTVIRNTRFPKPKRGSATVQMPIAFSRAK